MSLGGEKIKEIRLQKGIKREELANKANISAVQLTNIEKKDMFPNASTLYKIANALDYDYDLLYDLFEKEKQNRKNKED
jgi:transcriptional regulator with XRE-family HTH domain